MPISYQQMLEQALIQLVLLEDALKQEMANDTLNAEHFYELYWKVLERGAQTYDRFDSVRH